MHSLFNDYQLITPLDSGTSSNIYLVHAKHELTDQLVFKIFDAIRLEQAQQLESFQQEVHQLKQLHHPYILPLLDGEVGQEHPILIYKYMPAGSLRNRLSSSNAGRIPLGEGLQMIVQIGQALSYSHAWNVLHGNIKPTNILFDDNGHALLTDFMLPSIKTNMVPRPQPDTRYMAPEQLEGKISKESDQYALGCLAYEVLTGYAPAAYQEGGLPVPLTQFVPTLPQHSEVAVLKALATNPVERHVSISAFIEAFTSYSLKVSAIHPIEAISEAAPQASYRFAAASPITMVMTESDIAALAVPRPPMPAAVPTDSQMPVVATLAAPPASFPQAMTTNIAAGVTLTAPTETLGTANGYEQVWQYAPVNTYEQSWQTVAAMAQTPQWQSEVGSTPQPSQKMRIGRRGWVVIALVCLVLLAAGTIPMLLPLANSAPRVNQQPETVTPAVTKDSITATVAQATPTKSAGMTPTPTVIPATQSTLIPVVQATTPTPATAATPRATVAPTPTPRPTATSAPTPRPTATPTATPQPTATPTPPCSCQLLLCSCH